MPKAVRAGALTIVIAILLRLAFGPGGIGYDASWALDWGREIARGELPSYGAPGAPTPHPLANLAGAALAPLGDDAIGALMALSWLSLAVLGLVAFALGRRLFSAWVGAAFALILVTRGVLIRETQEAVVDIPFLALVLGALLCEVQRPRAGLRVPALLAVAGLLRPEAWLLGAAWLVYARRPAAAPLVAAAPVLWCVHDLVITGDPLHSLTGTRELAAELGRPTGLATAVESAPEHLGAVLGAPVVWLGLAGAVVAWRRAPVPAALLVLGLLGFLFLGVAELPLIVRYLLLPGAMLALFAAALALGWTALPAGHPGRIPWLVAGVAGLAVLAAFVPSEADRLAGLRDGRGPRVAVHADLRRLVELPQVRLAAARCGTVWTPSGRGRRLELAYWLDRPLTAIPAREAATPDARGLFLVYATRRVARAVNPRAPTPAGARALPAGATLTARNESWLAGARC